LLHANVEVQGVDRVKKDLLAKLGKVALRKRGQAALEQAADTVLLPAMQREAPPPNPTSPWRRPNGRSRGKPIKPPGPMKSSAFSKPLKPRTTEIAARYLGFRVAYANMVMRGTKPHDIPNYLGRRGYTYQHPGAKSNDIIGRTLSKGNRKRVTDVVKTHLMRN
jgi:hypothetical protein